MTDRSAYEEIEQLFAEAENRLKIIEALPGIGLAFPVVNQLRYAGYHLLTHINGTDQEGLRLATRHCKRAVYDAYELEIGFALKTFHAFNNDFKELVISETISEWVKWVRAHQDARNVIAKHRKGESRGDYYAELKPHLDILLLISKELPIAREELNKKIEIKKQQQLQLQERIRLEEENARLEEIAERKKAQIRVLVAIVSLFLGVAFWLFPEEGRNFGSMVANFFGATQSTASEVAPSRD